VREADACSARKLPLHVGLPGLAAGVRVDVHGRIPEAARGGYLGEGSSEYDAREARVVDVAQGFDEFGPGLATPGSTAIQ